MERVRRPTRAATRRTVEKVVKWRLNWADEGVDKVAYVGRWRVGRVVRKRSKYEILYVAHVNVPWINGPIAQERSMLLAQTELRKKVEEWLGGFSDDIPDTSVQKTRVRRA